MYRDYRCHTYKDYFDITILYKIDVHKVKWTTIRINMLNMMIKIATSSDLLLFCYYTMPREQNH